MTTADEFCESGAAYLNNNDKASALAMFQRAIMLDPKHALAWNNRGTIMLQGGMPFEALWHFRQAVHLEPRAAEYLSNVAVALTELGELEEAERVYNQALSVRPKFVQALTNLGNVQKALGNPHKALSTYRRAIEVDPTYVDAHLNLSFAALAVGEFEEGWKEYAWRYKSGQVPPRGLPLPTWEGADLKPTDRVIVTSEQGLGDAVQFCRYASLLKQKYGCAVYVEVRLPLARLIHTLEGIDRVVVFGEQPPPGLTFQVSMMDLPRLMGTNSIQQIPGGGAYLSANAHRMDAFRAKLTPLPGRIRIGVCWAGQHRAGQAAAAAIDKQRSTTLASFAPAASVLGIGWVSLQLGPAAEQLKNGRPPNMVIGDWMPDVDDFYDTAALIKCLDLVITVDTAVAHVSAALGVPTWILSRYDNCWRWLGRSEKSPWYNSIRQFVQPRAGDWEGLQKEVGSELPKFVEEHSASKAA